MKKLYIGLLLALVVIPGISFASIDANLKYGARGIEVKELQDFLIDKGFLTGEPSGNFFSLTRKAVTAYQSSIGLPATGYVGPMTRAKINADLAKSNSAAVSAEKTETGTIAQSTATTSKTPTSAASMTISGNKILTLANGSQVEVDNNGNILRFVSTTPQSAQTQAPTLSIPAIAPIDSNNLAISNISVLPAKTSAHIEWNTSTPTNSKVFVTQGGNTQIVNSISGQSTRHIVDISNLSSSTQYSYEIEAVAGTQSQKAAGSFTTASMCPAKPEIKLNQTSKGISTNPPTIQHYTGSPSGESQAIYFDITVSDSCVTTDKLYFDYTIPGEESWSDHSGAFKVPARTPNLYNQTQGHSDSLSFGFINSQIGTISAIFQASEDGMSTTTLAIPVIVQ